MSVRPILSVGLVLLAVLAPLDANGQTAMPLAIASRAFSDHGEIPRRYTCEGTDESPPLDWSGVPDGTESLVLIVDDPDAPDPQAPKTVWVHWVVYNLPPDLGGLPGGAGRQGLPAGAQHGLNDWNRADYGGPCPPIGTHRYVHKLYALDSRLTGLKSATKADLLAAMEGHVIAEAQLVGTYQKAGK